MDLLNAHELTIPLGKALDFVDESCKKIGLSPGKRAVMQAYVQAIDEDGTGQLRWDRVDGLLENLEEALKKGDPSFLEERRGYKWKHIPDVIEFVESKEYADQGRSVWESTKDNLWKIHHELRSNGAPPCIIVLSGCAGGGKSETAKLSALYTMFLLQSMWNPHLELGQNPDSWMVFAIQSIRQSTAEDSIYDKLKNAMDRAPWFIKHAPRRADYNAEIHFPNHIKIVPLTGAFNAAVGKDVVFFVCNEINEAPVHEKSKRLKNSDKTKLDVGKEMFDTLMNRIDTRFSRPGGLFPGKGIIDSSRTHRGDFTDQMRKRADTDPTILFIEKMLWEAKAHEYPADEARFPFECGDFHKPPRMLNSIEDAINPGDVVWVPMRHYQRFLSDPEEAAKDMIGRPTSATGRFIPHPEKVTRVFVRFKELYGDARLFRFESVDLNELFGEVKAGESVDWDLLINQDFITKCLDKTIPISVHVDVATSGDGDALGIGFTKIVSTKVVDHSHRFDYEEQKLVEVNHLRMPTYCTDALLQVTAKRGEKINLNLIRDLVFELRRRKYNIVYGSSDWIESTAMLQAWGEHGVVADHVSVDRTPNAYYELRQAILDERWICQPHRVVDVELRSLQKESKGKNTKIDHPPGGSKDVADAASGSVWTQWNTEGRDLVEQLDDPDDQDGGGDLMGGILEDSWRG